jgi:MtrB/PioB family decaheme-associated outer membrane protein
MKTSVFVALVVTLAGVDLLAQAPASQTPQAGATPAAATRAAAAQPAASGVPPVFAGEIDFGVRVSSIPAMGRFMRFEDPRSGATLQRLDYSRLHDAWRFNTLIENPGYRDQRYAAAFERFGRFAAAFSYTQVPLWYGDVERTPYAEAAPGVFRLDDAVQAAVQAGGSTTLYGSTLRNLDLRSQRGTTDGRLDYWATRNLDLSVAVKSTSRTGAQPWGASFGFSDATVVPLTIDRRNNDVSASAEWSNPRGMVKIGYDGSWFDNRIDTLVWDNPLRATDTTNANAYSTGIGASQGRMSLWPDSTAHTVSGSGSIALPHRSRLFAYVSVGAWLQDDELQPFTINTAIAPIPLARATAEAKAIITSMNYRYTSRPTANTWFTVNYRLYDFDNQSEPFPLTNVVRVDGTVAESPSAESEPFGYKRQFADADFSYTKFRRVALRGGYGVEHDHRTYRYVETTTDQQVRASIDSTGLPWGSVRVQYDRSYRTGQGLDEQVFEDINEQISLRQFDIANRTRDRISAIVQYLPVGTVGLSATGSFGRERRPESAFGLQDNDVHGVTFGVDYTPTPAVVAALEYGYDMYSTVQRSRQANPPPDPTFTDPRRDWQTDEDEKVHSISASLNLPHLGPRTSLRLGYDDVRDRSGYVYTLAANSTLPPVQQLPDIYTHFSVISSDLRYTLSKRFSIGAGYRLDHFYTDDFALTPGIMNTPFIPTFLNLQYQWRPYDAHQATVRVLYNF